MDLSGTVASRPILPRTVQLALLSLGVVGHPIQKAILQEAQLLPLAAYGPGL